MVKHTATQTGTVSFPTWVTGPTPCTHRTFSTVIIAKHGAERVDGMFQSTDGNPIVVETILYRDRYISNWKTSASKFVLINTIKR